MIAVGAHIADAEGGVGKNLAFDFEAPRFNGGSFQVWLHPTRDDLRFRIVGIRRNTRKQNALYRVDRVVRTVLIQAVT